MSLILQLLVFCVPVIYWLTCEADFRYFLNPLNTFWLGYLYFAVAEPVLTWDQKISLYGEGTFNKALLMWLVAGMAVCVGSMSSLPDKIARRTPVIRAAASERRLLAAGIVVFCIGILSHYAVIEYSGGWEEYISAPRTATNYEAFTGYLNSIPYFEPLGILMLMAYCYRHRPSIVIRTAVRSLFVAQCLWYVYSGTRSGIITMAVVYLGAKYGVRRKDPPLVLGVLSLGGVLLLVGFIAVYRTDFYGLQFHSNDTFSEMLTNSLGWRHTGSDYESPNNDEFGMTLAVARYVPVVIRPDYGRQFLEIFTRAIPRHWWPGKIYPDGEAWDRVHRVAGTSQSMNAAGLLAGPSPGFAGKWYYVAEWIGILIGGLLVGVMCRAVHAWTGRMASAVGAVAATVMANIGFSEALNPILGITSWLPAFGLPLLVMAIIVRERGRRPRLAPAPRPRFRRLKPPVAWRHPEVLGR